MEVVLMGGNGRESATAVALLEKKSISPVAERSGTEFRHAINVNEERFGLYAFSRCRDLLKGILHISGEVVASREAAEALVARMSLGGNRVIIKCFAESEEQTHKLKGGAIIFDAMPGQAARFYDAWEGKGEIVVQRCISAARQIMIGAKQTPFFGPAILFGTGGSDTERYSDIVPIVGEMGRDGALHLPEEIVRQQMLKTIMGRGLSSRSADFDAAAKLIMKLYEFMLDNPQIAELDLNPVCTSLGNSGTLTGIDVRMKADVSSALPEFRAVDEAKLDAIEYAVCPKSVALVGATDKPGAGATIVKLLRKKSGGKSHELYLVNPKRKESGEKIFGQKCCALEDIANVDLAVITAPAKAVPRIYEQIAREGKAKCVIIISDGFRETKSEEGVRLERELVALHAIYKVPIIGPNGLGVEAGPLSTRFFEIERTVHLQGKESGIGGVFQSGGIGARIIEKLGAQGLPLDLWFSIGNAACTNAREMLEFMARKVRQGKIRQVAAYLEDFSDGANLCATVRGLAAQAPVLAMAGGTSELGAKKAATHTGSMAGDGKVTVAALEQSGAFVFSNQRQFAETLLMLASHARPRTSNVVVMSNGGGITIVSADQISKSGSVGLAKISESGRERLGELIGTPVSEGNPLDLLGPATNARICDALQQLRAEKDVGGIILHLYPQVPGISKDISDVMAAMRECERDGVPVFLIVEGDSEYSLKIAEQFRRKGFAATHDFDPYTLAKAFEIWAKYGVDFRPAQT
jgi:acyl-CoA synthetase (NDP forming)